MWTGEVETERERTLGSIESVSSLTVLLSLLRGVCVAGLWGSHAVGFCLGPGIWQTNGGGMCTAP